MKVRLCAIAAALLLGTSPALAQPAPTPAYPFPLPPGFPAPKVPADNPLTLEKAELGRLLFYDTRLSGNETFACASCHRQESAFTDGRETAIGSTGEIHPRNSMSLTNVAYFPTMAWNNPASRELEHQALDPMFGETPIELGLSGLEDVLLERLRDDARYRRMFGEAFPEEADPFSISAVVRAIASFQRRLISGNSPYDQYIYQQKFDAMSASALRGLELFFSERLECFHCHGGFNFSSSVEFASSPFIEAVFFNNALYNIDGAGAYPPENTGIHEFTLQPEDMGRFKPPSLRNIELTAPYMHDGSIATLDEMLDHYAAGGRTIEEGSHAGVGSENPLKSGFMVGFRLDEREREDVLNFMKSLTDLDLVTDPRFGDPFAPASCLGDCNYSGGITVGELVSGVNISLGDAALASCLSFDANADGNVSIGELVTAVRLSDEGCP